MCIFAMLASQRLETHRLCIELEVQRMVKMHYVLQIADPNTWESARRQRR